MKETIGVKELFQVLRQRLWIIIVITVAAAVTSWTVSNFFITPIYETSTQILVNQKKLDNAVVQYNDVQTNLQLVNTYSIIIKSPAIMEKVKENLNLDMSVKNLTEKIEVVNEQDSQVISVIVQDSDSGRARDIANTIAEVFQTEIPHIMNIDNVTILAKAEAVQAQEPIKPRPILNTMIAAVVGLVVSIGLSIMIEYLDNTIKKEQDIEAIPGLPVLGIVAPIEVKVSQETTAFIKKVGGQTIDS
ncbi:Wzz/FepE/Etk N-terminal domain-containing protein [Bacillus sp. 165]|uniref:YveK family protein n=1 Tax=Bacillus sp. 165 TaxID=1529117 RepID=UPI001ADCA2DF|nr:Wzz/FepE/Etk N-terminal domain-containing protein [Bacillus sp. 165]MBO9130002.1 capsular biosynthesis protein [Bacillus sp. 165]